MRKILIKNSKKFSSKIFTALIIQRRHRRYLRRRRPISSKFRSKDSNRTRRLLILLNPRELKTHLNPPEVKIRFRSIYSTDPKLNSRLRQGTPSRRSPLRRPVLRRLNRCRPSNPRDSQFHPTVHLRRRRRRPKIRSFRNFFELKKKKNCDVFKIF